MLPVELVLLVVQTEATEMAMAVGRARSPRTPVGRPPPYPAAVSLSSFAARHELLACDPGPPPSCPAAFWAFSSSTPFFWAPALPGRSQPPPRPAAAWPQPAAAVPRPPATVAGRAARGARGRTARRAGPRGIRRRSCPPPAGECASSPRLLKTAGRGISPLCRYSRRPL